MDQRELISLKENIRNLGDKMREQEVFYGNVNDFLRKAYRHQSLTLSKSTSANELKYYRPAL